MKVIKRDGHMVDWCPEKVEEAVLKANLEVEEEDRTKQSSKVIFFWILPKESA